MLRRPYCIGGLLSIAFWLPTTSASSLTCLLQLVETHVPAANGRSSHHREDVSCVPVLRNGQLRGGEDDDGYEMESIENILETSDNSAAIVMDQVRQGTEVLVQMEGITIARNNKIVFTKGESTITVLEENHPVSRSRKRQRRRTRRTNSNTLTTGVHTVTVFTVSLIDLTIQYTQDQVQEYLFSTSNPGSMASQLNACSGGQLTLVSNGMHVVHVNRSIAEFTQETALRKVVYATMKEQGLYGSGSLSLLADHVMFFFPKIDQDCYLSKTMSSRSWWSIYQDEWSLDLMNNLHTMGHQMGLKHAGHGFDTKGDWTSNMGSTNYFPQLGTPRKCYNAYENHQLGWYDAHKTEYNVAPNGPVDLSIASFTNIGSAAAADSVLVVMENLAIQYNKQSSFNNGTELFENQLVISEWRNGQTWALAGLDPLQQIELYINSGSGRVRHRGLANEGRKVTVKAGELKTDAQGHEFMSVEAEMDPPAFTNPTVAATAAATANVVEVDLTLARRGPQQTTTTIRPDIFERSTTVSLTTTTTTASATVAATESTTTESAAATDPLPALGGGSGGEEEEEFGPFPVGGGSGGEEQEESPTSTAATTMYVAAQETSTVLPTTTASQFSTSTHHEEGGGGDSEEQVVKEEPEQTTGSSSKGKGNFAIIAVVIILGVLVVIQGVFLLRRRAARQDKSGKSQSTETHSMASSSSEDEVNSSDDDNAAHYSPQTRLNRKEKNVAKSPKQAHDSTQKKLSRKEKNVTKSPKKSHDSTQKKPSRKEKNVAKSPKKSHDSTQKKSSRKEKNVPNSPKKADDRLSLSDDSDESWEDDDNGPRLADDLYESWHNSMRSLASEREEFEDEDERLDEFLSSHSLDDLDIEEVGIPEVSSQKQGTKVMKYKSTNKRNFYDDELSSSSDSSLMEKGGIVEVGVPKSSSKKRGKEAKKKKKEKQERKKLDLV